MCVSGLWFGQEKKNTVKQTCFRRAQRPASFQKCVAVKELGVMAEVLCNFQSVFPEASEYVVPFLPSCRRVGVHGRLLHAHKNTKLEKVKNGMAEN